MAGSVNKVILIGNLGQDPEVKSFQNGGRIANLRIATSENWKDKNTGERKERTEWHTVVSRGLGRRRTLTKKGPRSTSTAAADTQVADRRETSATAPSLSAASRGHDLLDGARVVGAAADGRAAAARGTRAAAHGRRQRRPSAPPAAAGDDDVDDDIPCSRIVSAASARTAPGRFVARPASLRARRRSGRFA